MIDDPYITTLIQIDKLLDGIDVKQNPKRVEMQLMMIDKLVDKLREMTWRRMLRG
jgi:hypothetical protein